MTAAEVAAVAVAMYHRRLSRCAVRPSDILVSYHSEVSEISLLFGPRRRRRSFSSRRDFAIDYRRSNDFKRADP